MSKTTMIKRRFSIWFFNSSFCCFGCMFGIPLGVIVLVNTISGA